MADPFQPARILVLDDDEVMHHLLEAVLSTEGFTIARAISGDDALAQLRAGQPVELVLTDLNMPGLEGRALAHALRNAMAPSTLLIGMSGSEPATATRDPLDAFLLKPFDLEEFHAAVASARHKRTATVPPAEVPSTASDEPVVLDDTIFQSLIKMIPPAKLGELYTMMLTDIEKRRSRIEDAARDGDLETAHREAHAIKGSCGMVGATELHKLAAAIEGGTTFDVAALEQIPAACARLRRMLESKFDNPA